MEEVRRRTLAVKPCPPQDRLKALFDYDAERGLLLWRHRPEQEFTNFLQYRAWNGHHAGKVAGSGDGQYRKIGIGEQNFLAHRLIWTWHHGDMPVDMLIDHIDGDGQNNRIENLRLATGSDNQRNLKPKARSATGCRGVYFNRNRGYYVASYRKDGKLVHLGTFSNLERAKRAADAARLALGYSVRHVGR